ncbi:FAD-dependent oxidoreductase [Patescibacteria group bacterium]|nr:FAD-dependent oxidoreductase [Patescibacteria group bacterium]
MIYDVIIIGSGPSGLTAGIYSTRLGLHPLIIAGQTWGGQLMLTTDVENYPGYRKITGPELMQKMRDQAEGLGVEIVDADCTRLETKERPFHVAVGDKIFEGKTVIVATGADTRWLDVPNEGKLRGRGVSSCAPCDAFFFRGKPVAVVGGGDSAMEETQVIAKVSPDVVLIHRRDEFRAQPAMVAKVSALPQVKLLYNTRVVDVLGDTVLTGLLLETGTLSPKQQVGSLPELVAKFGGEQKSGTQWILPRSGVFVAIGLIPNTDRFPGLTLDAHGNIVRYEEKDGQGMLSYFTKTNIPGVFTAGDVHDGRYKQAITAAAFGCMAALDVARWLSETDTHT